MNKRLYGIRGAVCADNTAESIRINVLELCKRVFEKNMVSAEDIVSIQFTVTDDLNALNPAAALRSGDSGLDVSVCALFCSQEPRMEHGLDHVIRLLVTTYCPDGAVPQHVYCNGAEILRPDFFSKKS
jgi:chorismate mutase